MNSRNGPQVTLPPIPEQFPLAAPMAGNGQPSGLHTGQPAPTPWGGPIPMGGQPPQQAPQQGQQPMMPYQIGPMGLPPGTPSGPKAGIPPLPPMGGPR